MATKICNLCRTLKKSNLFATIRMINGCLSMQTSTRCISITSSTLGLEGIRINMPSLSPTMQQGTIVKWYKTEGDTISAGDVLCDIQTDKAIVAMDTEEDGVMAKIIIPEGMQDVQIGALIALMVEEDQDWKYIDIPSQDTKADTDASVCKVTGNETPTDKSIRVFLPAVRSLLEMYAIEPLIVTPSGPHSRLLKGDVLKYIKEKNLKHVPIIPTVSQAEAPNIKIDPTNKIQAARKPFIHVAPTSLESKEYIDIEITQMRKAIAKRVTESKKTIPYLYASTNCQINKLLKVKEQLQKKEIQVSVNDFIIKAAALALQNVPEVNTVWTSNGPMSSPTIDISVAVAIDGGLMTPIVKDSNVLSIKDISMSVRELAIKAKDGTLNPHHFQGGSFSISNLGMYGLTEFTAIINPPQTAILAVGMARVILGTDSRPETIITVTLSADNRIIDETKAFDFIEHFKSNMEHPASMLLGTLHHTVH